MRQISHLPGRLDGAEGLLRLVKVYGEVEVFELIMLCRTARGDGQDPGGEVLTILGNQLVKKIQADHPEYTELKARQEAARRLGFHDAGSRSNFTQILKGGRRNFRAKKAS